jgi:predicted dehydrogenase
MVTDTMGDTPALWDIVQRSSGGTVAEIQSHNCDDARLIAAAPQLLSALQRLTRPDDGRGPADDDLAYALDAIHAATGSQ